MNATSLYVSTCRLVLQADSEDSSSWTDLFRLVPYLRQSLSCTVCGNLLIEPYTPTETNCQHHVCRSCKGGRKKLKPSCSWCKNYEKYVENVQLRILLQCYKKLCEYVTSTSIYRSLFVSATSNGGSGDGTSSLVELIQEGAGFKDDFKSNAGLSKSAYSILPCVYTSTSTQTQTGVTPAAIGQSEGTNGLQAVEPQAIRTVSNGSSLYSVMFQGTGNKITIKRKANDLDGEPGDGSGCNADSTIANGATNNWDVFKKPAPRGAPVRGSGGAKRRGCRCGNATATPGKLTCCGQRCPCYVESKACVECRCRGCRNPHRPGGKKVVREWCRKHRDGRKDVQDEGGQGAKSVVTADVISDISKLSAPFTHNLVERVDRKVRPLIPELQSLLPALEDSSCDGSAAASVQVVYAEDLPPSLLLPDARHAADCSPDDTSDIEVDV